MADTDPRSIGAADQKPAVSGRLAPLSERVAPWSGGCLGACDLTGGPMITTGSLPRPGVSARDPGGPAECLPASDPTVVLCPRSACLILNGRLAPMVVFFGAVAALVGAAGRDGAVAGELCVACEGPAVVYRCQIEGQPATDHGGEQFLCIKDIALRAGHASCAASRSASADCSSAVPWVVARQAADSTGAIVPRLAPGRVTAGSGAPPQAPGPASAPSAPGDAATTSGEQHAPRADTAGGQAAQPLPAFRSRSSQDSAVPATPPAANAPPNRVGTMRDGNAATFYVPPNGRSVRSPEAGAAGGWEGSGAAAGRGLATQAGADSGGPSAVSADRGAEPPGYSGNAIGGVAKKSWDCLTSLFSKC